MSELIRSAVVVGGGVTGRLTALALARLVPRLQVTCVGWNGDDSWEDLIGATRPSIRAIHQRLRVSEEDLLANTGSCFRLGSRMTGWGREDFFQGHGEHGRSVGGVHFHQLWARAGSMAAGRFDDYSLAARLAGDGRFAHPLPDPTSPSASLDYGLQIDMRRYASGLRALGRLAGVRDIEISIGSIETNNERTRIERLELADGSAIRADIYIDATGPSAMLRNALPNHFIDWTGILPVDRLLCVTSPSTDEPPPSDLVTARTAGWTYSACTSTTTSTLLAYSSASLTDDQAIRVLQDVTGQPVTSAPISLRQGYLREPWTGNCLAVGAAAVALEPLAQSNLHLLCRQIDRMIDFWPDRRFAPVEIAPYNRRAAIDAERAKDFIHAHYLLAHNDTPFWQMGRRAPASPELQRDLDLFGRSGTLGLQEDDGLERDEWISLMLGQGMSPLATAALAAEVASEQVEHILARERGRVEQALSLAPSHSTWLKSTGQQQ